MCLSPPNRLTSPAAKNTELAPHEQEYVDNQLANSGIGGNYIPKGEIWISRKIVQPIGNFTLRYSNKIGNDIDKGVNNVAGKIVE